jgi:hypothetical protein
MEEVLWVKEGIWEKHINEKEDESLFVQKWKIFSKKMKDFLQKMKFFLPGRKLAKILPKQIDG